MRSIVSFILVRVTWLLTVAALLALSTSAGLFDLSRPAQAATAALSSPAGQRLATDFIADQLRVAVPGLSDKQANDLAAKVASDPGTLVALRKANLNSASAPQDRAALLDVVASQLKESNPKVAAATKKYASQVKATAADQSEANDTGLAEPPSPVGGILERIRQFTGGATNFSAVMSDLKERLANLARILAGLAAITALGALLFAPSRSKVVRSFGWMFISISLIPAAIGWLVPDLVLGRMSSDWAQALAVGLRVGGSRLIGLFIGLLIAGVVLLILGMLGPRLGSMFTSSGAPRDREPREPGERERPIAPVSAGRRSQEASQAWQPYPEEQVATTRPIETGHYDDPRYAAQPSGYQQPFPEPYQPQYAQPQQYQEPYPPQYAQQPFPEPYQQQYEQQYPESYPQPQQYERPYPQSQRPVFVDDPQPSYDPNGPYGEPPTEPDPYAPPRDGRPRRRNG